MRCIHQKHTANRGFRRSSAVMQLRQEVARLPSRHGPADLLALHFSLCVVGLSLMIVQRFLES
jgi:hypothetical protein